MATKKKGKSNAPSLPKVGTKAAENFFRSHISIIRFFNWVLYMATRMDAMSDHAHKTLLSIEEDPVKKEEMISKQNNKQTMLGELKQNRQFLLEVILVRHIENFLNYLSKLLYEIFTQKPETLRSSEKVELSLVLKFKSIDEFVLAAAERKVENLSYSSFGDLYDFFSDRFGLKLFDENEISKIINAIETRNISVHNRCIINERYCIRAGEDTTKIGKKRQLYIDYVEEINNILLAAVKNIDKQTKKKLNIKGIRFDLEPATKGA